MSIIEGTDGGAGTSNTRDATDLPPTARRGEARHGRHKGRPKTAQRGGGDHAATPVTDPGELRTLLEGTLCQKLGMGLQTIGPDGGVMTMPVAEHTQPAGLLHGGATIALAESVASMAALLQAREVHGAGAQAVGTSVGATHHRSAKNGTVTATCRAQHRGRQVATYLVEVTDEAGTLLSTVVVSTMLLAPREPLTRE